jgi:hypothetical protein
MTRKIERASFAPIMDIYEDGSVTIDFSDSLLNFYDESGMEILEDQDTPEWMESMLARVSMVVNEAIGYGGTT